MDLARSLRGRDRLVCGAAGALLLASSVLGQAPPAYKDGPAIPDLPPARHVRAAIDAVNSDDPAKIAAFCREHMTEEMVGMAPEAEHVAVFRGVFAEPGGLDYHGVRTYAPPRPDTDMVVIVRKRLTEEWRAIVLSVVVAEPYRIAGMNFAGARTPSDVAPEPARSEAEAIKELERHVDRLAGADRFWGAVLVAKGDTVLLEKAWGFADRGFDARNTPETLFNLGSMNKMITAVCIAQLVEKGTLSFDDPVGKWLGSDWVSPETGEKVRLKHLLSHTSGLGSYFNEEWERSSRALYRDLDDWKAIVAPETPQFEPGTAERYSNTGFLLLGAVVEKASGQDYFEYVRENIYEPAGMTRSDSYDVDEPPMNLATGYVPERGPDGKVRWRTNVFLHVARGGPAGGGYSTVRDLLALSRALQNGTLVSPAMFRTLTTAKPDLMAPRYGYGFGVTGTQSDRIVGHSGGFSGISANLDIFVDRGYTIVVLANNGRAEPVAQRADALLARR